MNEPNPNAHPDERRVTVCDHCLTASCWHGRFMCDDAQGAGTVDLPLCTLKRLEREHPDNWEEADD